MLPHPGLKYVPRTTACACSIFYPGTDAAHRSDSGIDVHICKPRESCEMNIYHNLFKCLLFAFRQAVSSALFI